MISKPTYQIIDDIISTFDFEFVRTYMVVNKWYWGYEESAPSIEKLINVAKSLLIEVIEESRKKGNNLFCCTGGFKASYFKYSNQYYLEFVIKNQYTGAN